MKRLWILLMVLAATAVVAAAAYAGSQRAATHATGSVRVLKTYAVGPFADCDFDSCGIGGVSPVTITIPEDTRPYRAVITASLQYHTTAGAFVIAADIRTLDGGRLAAFPAERRVRPTTTAATATVVFASPALQPGATYRVDIGANIRGRVGDQARISTSNLVVSVDAKPVN